MFSMARCNPAANGAPQRRGNLVAVLQTESRIELLAEPALAQTIRVEEAAIDARPIAPAQNLLEQRQKLLAGIGRREPLDFVFIGSRVESQQLRHAAVQIAQRIRIVEILFQVQLISGSAPARGGAEIAVAIQRQHRGIIERRWIIRRGRMRRVMLHHQHLGTGKLRSQREMNLLRERTHQGDAIHIRGRQPSHFQRRRDGGFRQNARR